MEISVTPSTRLYPYPPMSFDPLNLPLPYLNKIKGFNDPKHPHVYVGISLELLVQLGMTYKDKWCVSKEFADHLKYIQPKWSDILHLEYLETGVVEIWFKATWQQATERLIKIKAEQIEKRQKLMLWIEAHARLVQGVMDSTAGALTVDFARELADGMLKKHIENGADLYADFCSKLEDGDREILGSRKPIL